MHIHTSLKFNVQFASSAKKQYISTSVLNMYVHQFD